MIRKLLAISVSIYLMASNAFAQPVSAASEAQILPPERIEIGLSTDSVAITSDFSGANLIIFGAVDNVDPLVQLQGRYDIFLVLEGPRMDVVARRKERVFGIWMNVGSQRFDTPPQSFLIASTRVSRDVTDEETISRLSLSVPAIRIRPADGGSEVTDADAAGENAPAVQQPDSLDEFTEAFRRLKIEKGLYRLFPGNVQFVSQSLFRAEIDLPANVPLGSHRAVAYLFRNGQLVAQTQDSLRIAKAGFEFEIFRFAKTQSLYYGLLSVLMALVVGWLGRVFFKKD